VHASATRSVRHLDAPARGAGLRKSAGNKTRPGDAHARERNVTKTLARLTRKVDKITWRDQSAALPGDHDCLVETNEAVGKYDAGAVFALKR